MRTRPTISRPGRQAPRSGIRVQERSLDAFASLACAIVAGLAFMAGLVPAAHAAPAPEKPTQAGRIVTSPPLPVDATEAEAKRRGYPVPRPDRGEAHAPARATEAPCPATTVRRDPVTIGTPGGPDPLVFDQRVSEPAWSSGAPDVASRSDGTLYAVTEDLDMPYLDIYVSENGGFTWNYWVSIPGVGEPRNPTIAIGEGDRNRLLVAYEDGSGTADAAIRLIWLDLDTQVLGYVPIVEEPYATLSAPRICVDSPEYAYWYPYVVWTRTIVGRGTSTQIQFSRSLDYADTFEAPSTLASGVVPAGHDVDFGGSTLYVVYTRETGTSNRDVYLRRSFGFGSSFDAEAPLATSAQDESEPRVAATVDGAMATVAFTKRYTISNTDVESYVTTDGTTWQLLYLPFDGLEERGVDLAASATDAVVHAVYQVDGTEIRSSWLGPDLVSPAWSSGRTVSEGTFPDGAHRPAVAANAVRPREAAMVWTTQTADEKRVYFDAAYPVGDLVVVLADAALAPAIEPFVTWKESIGYAVTTTTVTQIFEQYGNGDDAERIRAYLFDASADARHVLLVGDVDLLPMRMLYPNDTRPAYGSDFYYADVSTTLWDLDADDRWGEFLDDAFDPHPDLIVGRLPFDDVASVQAFANNVVAFEQASSAWKRNVLYSHGMLDHEARPSGVGTDAAYVSEAIIAAGSLGGLGQVTQYEKGGVHTSSFACDQDLQQGAFRSELGWGAHGVVCAMAHGSRTHMASVQWKTDADEDFIADPAEEYTYNWFSHWDEISSDPAVGVVSLFGCSTGALLGEDPCFDASPLRSHYLIRTTQPSMMMKEYLRTGAGAVIGATAGADYAGGWTDSSQGKIQTLATYFFEALGSGAQRAGDALHAAAVRYADTHGLARGLRVFHCFGDPTLTIGDIDVPGGVPRTASAILAAEGPSELELVARGGSCPPSSVDWSRLGQIGDMTAVLTILASDGELLAGGMAPLDASNNQGVVARSLDAGETWVLHGVPGVSSIRAIARTAAGRLIAGGGSYDGGDHSGRIYTSDDDGATWTLRHAEEGGAITGLVVRTGGDVIAATAAPGYVYGSTTEGQTWAQLAYLGADVSVGSVAEISRRLFLTLDEPGALDPVQQSVDGMTWSGGSGLGSVAAAHAIVRGWDGAYYVGVSLSDGSGRVYRSEDAGSSWGSMTELPDTDVRAVTALRVGPDGTLHAGVSLGWGSASTRIYARPYGTSEWEQLGAELDLAHRVRAFAVDGDNVYAGTGDLYGRVFAIAHEVSVDVPDAAPPAFAMLGSTPNPFRTGATIRYALPAAGAVTLRIFDARGREIRTLLDGRSAGPGVQEVAWDGRDADGRAAPAGVYFYRLDTTFGRSTGRLVRTR